VASPRAGRRTGIAGTVRAPNRRSRSGCRAPATEISTLGRSSIAARSVCSASRSCETRGFGDGSTIGASLLRNQGVAEVGGARSTNAREASGDGTVAQVAVLVRFVFQILRVEFAGRTLLRPMRSAPRSRRSSRSRCDESADQPQAACTPTPCTRPASTRSAPIPGRGSSLPNARRIVARFRPCDAESPGSTIAPPDASA